jgi:tetratricopeptide (TPR) repeat protein
LLENAIVSNDTTNQAQVYRYKANYYKNASVNDSAFYYYLKAEKLYKKLKDSSNIANILTNKSIVQYNAGDYVGADRSLTESYTLLKNSNDNSKLFNTLNMMGIVSNETKDSVRAIEYGTKALELVRKNKLKTVIHEEATSLNNLGFYYQNQTNYKEAINNYKIALQDKKLVSEAPDLYSFLVDNLAYSKFKLKEYDGLPGLFYKSLKVREQINAPTLIVLSKIHLSEYYAAKNDSILAQKFAREALALSKSSGIVRDLLAALKQSSNVDHDNATKFSKDYIRISDSIQGVERNSQEKFSRLQLETDEIIQENSLLEEKNRGLLYFFVVASILIILLFIIRSQRAKTREFVLKQAQSFFH